jgi:hypothetical protein
MGLPGNFHLFLLRQAVMRVSLYEGQSPVCDRARSCNQAGESPLPPRAVSSAETGDQGQYARIFRELTM